MIKRVLLRVAALAVVISSLLMLPAQALASTTDKWGNEIIVITIDPGHGGIDSGAKRTYDGVEIYERDLNLQIAQYIKEYLEENYWNVQVLLTREDNDHLPTYEERVKFAADNNSDFCLSTHLNAGNGDVRGSLALVPQGIYRPEQGYASRTVAAAIQEELEKAGVRNGGFYEATKADIYPDGTPQDAYFIVRYGVLYNVPTIIMEQCYLDNVEDYNEFLTTEEKLRTLAAADAIGLEKTMGLEPLAMKPPEYPSSAENGDTPFEDIFDFERFWFYDDVTYVYENNLIQGMTETTFAPFVTATRAMVVTLLYRIEGAEETAAEASFTDVDPEDWFYDEVEWAFANDVTQGIDEARFEPDRNVTREQFVTFLYRYAAMRGCAVESEQELEDFTDRDTISEYAVDAFRWAVEKEMVQGYLDDTIRPQQELNRGELAALMHRFDEYLKAEAPDRPEDPAEPTEPDDTTEPTEPDDTTEPTEPDDTTEPTEPDDTTEPTEPDDTTEPTEPDDTTDPTEPDDTTEPTKPDDTTQPTGPDDTIEPSQPDETEELS